MTDGRPTHGVVLWQGSLYWKCRFEDNALAKSIPGYRFDKKIEAWKYPATPATAKRLLELAGSYYVGDEVRDLAQVIEGANRVKVEEEIPDHPSKRPSWHHQKRAYRFLEKLPAGMLAMEMRTGKTKVVVDLIANLSPGKVLVVAPKSVVENEVWPREFEESSINPNIKCVTLTGPIKRRAEIVRAAGEGTLVFITNYESVWREPLGSVLLGVGLDMVVLDESHRIKAAGSKVSKYFVALGRRVPRRICLTGTPTPESPLDIYGQYRFLDPGIFGTNFTAFKHRYAVTNRSNPHHVLGYRVKPTLANGSPNPYFDPEIDREYMDKLHSICFRVRQDEVFDMPPIDDLTRNFTLSGKARSLYVDLEKEMVAKLEGGEVTADNVLTKALRLRQITSGHTLVQLEDGSTRVEVVDSGKAGLLADILEDLPRDEPVVVFGEFVHDLNVVRQVSDRLGRPYMELSGRRNDLKEWQAGRGVILGVNIKAGGAGLDFTRACYAIYYSHCYSLGDYEQSRSRLLGSKQTRPVTFFHLVAKGTIDEVVVATLQGKKDLTSYLTNPLYAVIHKSMMGGPGR